VVVGQAGGKPRMQLLDWPFFPLINRYADHPITRNLDAVITRFASSMDTVKAQGIKKTPLLFTSQYSRTVTAPVRVDINALRENIDIREFNKPNIPVAYLLEGKFTSVFKNRFLPEGVDGGKFKSDGESAKIIVVSDGDIAKNDYNTRTRQPLPLGYDQATQYTFANRDLLLNMMAFLTDENGLISARNKEVKIRPLDKQKIQDERLKWQVINLVLPLIVLIAFGAIRAVLRKRKYAAFQ
jgi:gliding-associated putative ABC transporter substrate-binding component GldG